jgi:hypothetical protein
MATTGDEQAHAVDRAAAALSIPGPGTTSTTPTRPVVRA